MASCRQIVIAASSLVTSYWDLHNQVVTIIILIAKIPLFTKKIKDNWDLMERRKVRFPVTRGNNDAHVTVLIYIIRPLLKQSDTDCRNATEKKYIC